MDTVPSPTPDRSPDFDILRKAAYDRTEPARLALSREDLLQVNLDINYVVQRALVVHKKVGALRDRFVHAPGVVLEEIDLLEDCALALSYAQARFLSKPVATSELMALNAEATKIRRTLYTDLQLLANRGRVDPRQFRTYSGRTGYKIVASDLLMMFAVIRQEWGLIQGFCACSNEELNRAEAIAVRILELVAQRAEAEGTASPEAEQRTRAFTLLYRCYASVRRAVDFVRWKERDVDLIAPSLHKLQKPRRTSKAAKKTKRERPLSPPSTRTVAQSYAPPILDSPFLR